MGSKGESKRTRLLALLAEGEISLVDEAAWTHLAEKLAPISNSYLRKLIKGTGLPLAAMVEGVCQDTLSDLERTLLTLQDEYERAEPVRKRVIRSLVITAKDHARWARRKPDKEEMLLWILTWLENPVLFRDWLAIRRRIAVPKSESDGSF